MGAPDGLQAQGFKSSPKAVSAGIMQCRDLESFVLASWQECHQEGSEKPCGSSDIAHFGGFGWVPRQRSLREASKQRGERPHVRALVGFLETFWTFEEHLARMEEFTGPQSNDKTTQTSSYPEATNCHE